ncbi:DMT family transporter [Leucobacter luti]|uniref:Quaternary ammonium compound-resistance protein SugE n=1 Tax=Leucobacter luti TaxID=340320 RepID=A0A4Q7TUW8_9MICO|nr:multidrug efflux SMR transporter [Leucobacter luti]MBL3698369.1 QacE family quaternary ammonium compound efflux SMR transporter [Leucobacter luti]RZT64543.1 quaternary ammonium compound-resistance protein SugE [Leucobacter luti]
MSPRNSRPAQPAAEKTPLTRHWVVLFASAVLEAVWALALKESHGFTVLAPTIVFAIANPISLIGLGYAMRGLPVSVAYAIWTGLGAALTVGASIAMGIETVSILKLVFLAGIVGCVIGLKFAKDPAAAPARASA